MATTSNAQSSNSKVYEGGSNEKNRLSQFEQQAIGNLHKTPQPNGSGNMQELTGATYPSFVQQSQDHVHLPELRQASSNIGSCHHSH